VEFGNASSSQNTLASVPAHLILDRSYLHGNPSYGQRRGLALNSADAEVTNSYFADFKGVSQDTQAIAGWNGPGAVPHREQLSRSGRRKRDLRRR